MRLDNARSGDDTFPFNKDSNRGQPSNVRVDPALPVMLQDGLLPLTRDGLVVPHYQDPGGTLHFFSAVDHTGRPEFDAPPVHLSYIRVAKADDGRLVYDQHPVMPLTDLSAVPFPRQMLDLMLMNGDLDNARALARHTAVSYGLPFPEPEALPPLDTAVRYGFQIGLEEDGSSAIQAVKAWREGLHEQEQRLTIAQYGISEAAARDLAVLNDVCERRGLEAAMMLAERMAVAGGYLQLSGDDSLLFTAGPPDHFMAAREGELLALKQTQAGEPIRNITHDDPAELPTIRMTSEEVPEPGSWDELVARQAHDEPQSEPHYWELHYRPVETPEGEHLGTALFVAEFPQLPPDFDDYVEENGMDDSIYPTEARTVEMAHFASDDDARKFETEFRSYLVPELLDGPELAPEVAKLEGLSGEWEAMNYNQIVDYMSGNRTVVREESAWHLHNPNAEREMREQIENLQTDIDL